MRTLTIRPTSSTEALPPSPSTIDIDPQKWEEACRKNAAKRETALDKPNRDLNTLLVGEDFTRHKQALKERRRMSRIVWKFFVVRSPEERLKVYLPIVNREIPSIAEDDSQVIDYATGKRPTANRLILDRMMFYKESYDEEYLERFRKEVEKEEKEERKNSHPTICAVCGGEVRDEGDRFFMIVSEGIWEDSGKIQSPIDWNI